MSRPSRIQDRRLSSSRSPVDSATAVARPDVRPGGSSATRSVSARRASAARRRSRSADLRRRGAGVRARRQVDHEDVDRSGGQEHPRDRQPFIERLWREDDEPVQADAAGGGLHRIERPCEVQPGDDRAVDLGLGDEPQGERRGARGRRPSQGHAGAARQPARPDDRIECREAGPDDPLDASSRLARRSRSELGWVVERLDRGRRRGQRSDHPRSCATPSRLEGRQSGRDVRGEAGHRTSRLEQTFDIVNPSDAARPQ